MGGSVKAVVEPFIAGVRGGRLGIGAMEARWKREWEEGKGEEVKRHEGEGPRLNVRTGHPQWLCMGLMRVVDKAAGQGCTRKGSSSRGSSPKVGQRVMYTHVDGSENVGGPVGLLAVNNCQKGSSVRIVMDVMKHGKLGQIGHLMKDKSTEQATVRLEEDSKSWYFPTMR